MNPPWSTVAQEKAEAQNNIFRLDVDSISPYDGTAKYLSLIDLALTDESVVFNSIADTIADNTGSGILNSIPVGSYLTIAGAVQTANNGVWQVASSSIVNDIVVLGLLPMQAQVMVDEIAVGNIAISSNSLAKNYRAVSFQDDVVVTFNEDASKTYDLLSYEVLYITQSMQSIATDVVTTIMWSN